jgi:hypothetical protein
VDPSQVIDHPRHRRQNARATTSSAINSASAITACAGVSSTTAWHAAHNVRNGGSVTADPEARRGVPPRGRRVGRRHRTVVGAFGVEAHRQRPVYRPKIRRSRVTSFGSLTLNAPTSDRGGLCPQRKRRPGGALTPTEGLDLILTRGPDRGYTIHRTHNRPADAVKGPRKGGLTPRTTNTESW